MALARRIKSNLPLLGRVSASLLSPKSPGFRSTMLCSHRCCSTSATMRPKKDNMKGRLLTGATIGLIIAGGAYVSTVDEATFWYFLVPCAKQIICSFNPVVAELFK